MVPHPGRWARETYTYDENGNLIDYNGTSYPTSASNNQIHKSGYAYDAFGERVKKTESGTTRYYLTSGPHILAEYDDMGALMMEHVYANGSRIATVIPGDDTYFTLRIRS